MRVSILFTALLCYCVSSDLIGATTENPDVIQYLVDYGYLESSTYTKYELRRSLRQLQKEQSLLVNGKITPEVVTLVKDANDQKMVIEYLKTFGYIQQDNITPTELASAVETLQRNSGVLAVTGTINSDTIHFIQTHPQGYSEGLFP